MNAHKTMPPPGNHEFTKLQKTYDLCVKCRKCCVGKTDISYYLVPLAHQCSRDIVLVRQKGNSNHWRPVGHRPKFPQPAKYDVCWYFKEGKGCKSHGLNCSFARSTEEAAVWNFMKKDELQFSQLINLLIKSSAQSTSLENLAPPTGCPEVVQKIISSSQGTFIELCKTCFNDNPQKISSREQGTSCSGHRWKSTLVFCQKGEQGRVVYDEIRPLPRTGVQQFKYCKYVEKGEPCWHGAHRCWFAHSSIERTVWMSESQNGLDRSQLLHASLKMQGSQGSGARSHAASQEQERQHYCQLCKCQFRTHEDFMDHCFTVKHRKLIFEDTPFTWKYRDPPIMSKIFKLCERFELTFNSMSLSCLL